MEVTRDKLLELLNEDIEWEYSALIQYVQHAAEITGAQFESLQKELIIHAQQEMNHATILSEQVNYLGGTPTVEVEKIEVAKDSVRMLEQDLAGEQNAIKRYKERIFQAEKLGEFGLRRIIEDVLIQEEEHERDLLFALGR
jgi:bacterioferritin